MDLVRLAVGLHYKRRSTFCPFVKHTAGGGYILFNAAGRGPHTGLAAGVGATGRADWCIRGQSAPQSLRKQSFQALRDRGQKWRKKGRGRTRPPRMKVAAGLSAGFLGRAAAGEDATKAFRGREEGRAPWRSFGGFLIAYGPRPCVSRRGGSAPARAGQQTHHAFPPRAPPSRAASWNHKGSGMQR